MKSNFLRLGSLVLLGSLAISSCKKDYLDTVPTDAVSSASAFTTTGNAMIALNGVHRLLYTQHYGRQDQGGFSANMIYADMLGEDLVNPTAANGWFMAMYKWQAHRNASSTEVFYNYAFFYEIIGNINQLLAGIDAAAGTPTERNLIKGEALAYRAWAYYQMIQLFGKRFDKAGANSTPGLPLVLVPTDGAKPRSTVAEVYTQINLDLDNAIVALTTANARPNKSHLNLSVAQGLKARVALTQQNWPLAATMAASARASYTLMTPAQYTSGFNDYVNPEWMWGSHQQADQQSFFYSFFAYMSANFNSTNIRTGPKAINAVIYNQLSATDIRKTLWDPTGTNAAVFPVPPGGIRAPYMNRKFLINPAGGGSSIGDVPLMRAAEMYLIEAEAKARNNDATAATALFQLVSKRDPAYVLSVNTGQALIDEIMLHRRIELWGEGFRFYDLKRLNLPLNRNGANHVAPVAVIYDVPAGDKQWEFLLPLAEINANPFAIQNDL